MRADRDRGVRRRAASTLLATVLVATGCSARDAPTRPPGAPGSDPAPPGARPTTPATPTSPAAERPPTVRIAVAGDVHFEGVLRDRLRDPASALAPGAPALQAADLAVLNLETSVGSGGSPSPGKRFVFSAPGSAFDALAAAGVDVAVMANNHALDLGRARIPSALAAARRAGVDVVGIGRDARTAQRAVVRDVGGSRVAVVAASVADQDPTADRTAAWAATGARPGVAMALDPTALLREVRRADRRADVVLAYLHWGVQGERCASPDQRRLARSLVRSGADAVVGSHAHQLQGDGRLGRGYVAYGLGNFAWYSPGTTGVLTLTVRPPRRPAGRADVTRTDWWPAQIGGDGVPRRVRGPDAARSAAERRSLRACSGLGQAPPG